ncbi:replication protein A [Ferrimonas balearica DSM 9799]|uniref:Replication protein A n=1 Tax=Ferrimonas balearica (strain DSM 9799 / CCM 4581 / KCTC 23876 / PAT) TaxID=550540 RepID=E1SVZ8_FERBD|nr:replication endonuclease [Ferrimonas balearica]ADN77449.1 replication protein A [Ferrimonas balearica DSM 9799]
MSLQTSPVPLTTHNPVNGAQCLPSPSDSSASVNVEWDDKAFVLEHLRKFPGDIQRLMMRGYYQRNGQRERNQYLLKLVQQIEANLGCTADLSLFEFNEEQLKRQAGQHSLFCYEMALRMAEGNRKCLVREIIRYGKSHGLRLCTRGDEVGFVVRACDPELWRRKLKQAIRQNREYLYRILNQVHRYQGIYCSDWQAKNHRQRRKKQQEFLDNTFMMNELEQEFSLAELAQTSTANPANRKVELMVRARGFEELADESGHVGYFITLTCPSRFHRAYAKTGKPNPKWDGSDVRDAQAHLNHVWVKTRSAYGKKGIQPYGFRVVEPQHDGTPHWHLLLFMPKEQARQFIQIFRHYALEVDGDEKGAAKRRLDVKLIDKEKGTATGYIAKYISKNIDGSDLDQGVYGENPIEAAERVQAWASTYRIRQFQPIGGASVTVWRELRRLKQALLPKDSQLQRIWEAANNGDWKGFIGGMGGIHLPRNERPVSPLYLTPIDEVSGSPKLNRFEELASRALKGIQWCGQRFISRIHQWQRIAAPTALGSDLEFCE